MAKEQARPGTREIEPILQELASAQKEYDAKANGPAAPAREASNRVVGLKRELSKTICEGAVNCPTCKAPPVGIYHDGGPKKGARFEVGCVNCRDHRAIGNSRKLAVMAWNEGPSAWHH